MEEPQIVERGKGTTGRRRNRSVCGQAGVACVLCFLLLKARWSWSGERIPRYACKRIQGCSRKRRAKTKIHCNSQYSSWHPQLGNVRGCNGVLWKEGKRNTETSVYYYTGNFCSYCLEFLFDRAVVCFTWKENQEIYHVFNCVLRKLQAQ